MSFLLNLKLFLPLFVLTKLMFYFGSCIFALLSLLIYGI